MYVRVLASMWISLFSYFLSVKEDVAENDQICQENFTFCLQNIGAVGDIGAYVFAYEEFWKHFAIRTLILLR